MSAAPTIPPRADRLAVALEIAETLCAGAVWHDGRCAFFGATAPEHAAGPARQKSFRGDLYEGSAGIARFLALASTYGASGIVRETALGALAHAARTCEGWSLFGGGAGIGLVALEAAERLDQPSLRQTGSRLVRQSSKQAVAGDFYDLLLGQAGVILALIAAKSHVRGDAWIDTAIDLGHLLLSRARDGAADINGETALSWPMGRSMPEHLCGLAHGASGFALAFEALGSVDSKTDWSAVARRARSFERAYFSPAAGSWADLRADANGAGPATATFPHMWCHGSIGIAAERLAANAGDARARLDAVAALAGVRRYAESLLAGPVGPGGGDAANGSLCHGIGGVIDVLIDAWLATQEAVWLDLADRLGDLMLNDSRRSGGWRSGVPGGGRAPGLMLGDAGIGWTFLRLADPRTVPSGWRPPVAERPLPS